MHACIINQSINQLIIYHVFIHAFIISLYMHALIYACMHNHSIYLSMHLLVYLKSHLCFFFHMGLQTNTQSMSGCFLTTCESMSSSVINALCEFAGHRISPHPHGPKPDRFISPFPSLQHRRSSLELLATQILADCENQTLVKLNNKCDRIGRTPSNRI